MPRWLGRTLRAAFMSLAFAGTATVVPVYAQQAAGAPRVHEPIPAVAAHFNTPDPIPVQDNAYVNHSYLIYILVVAVLVVLLVILIRRA